VVEGFDVSSLKEIHIDIRDIQKDIKAFIKITTSNKVSIRYLWYAILLIAGWVGIPKLFAG